MKNFRYIIAAVSAAAFMSATPVIAETEERQRIDHYEGKESTTLEEAVENYKEYNRKLNAKLQGEMTPETLAEIHQLTYTLENAVAKIQSELSYIAEKLEEVHVASETMDYDTVKSSGAVYIEKSRTLVPDNWGEARERASDWVDRARDRVDEVREDVRNRDKREKN